MRKLFFLIPLSFILTLTSKAIAPKDHIIREKQYDVKFYFLDLSLDKGKDTIGGNVLIRAQVLVNNFDTFAVELDDPLLIDSVMASLDGGPFQTATVSRSTDFPNILLPFTTSINHMVEVRIYYHGKPKQYSANPFLFPNAAFVSGSSTEKFSLSPPYNSYQWWPCKQDLTDKADSSWFFITTDSSAKGLSNGLLKNTVKIPNTKFKRWEWKSKYPIDFYLISFVVKPCTEYTQYWKPTGRTDSMLLKFYNVNYTGNKIQKILQVFSDLFGHYPFYEEKLGIADVNLSGGMENQTMISLGASTDVEAHEIAHQWWGDNVTCGSFKDVFVNESFATWCEITYPEFTSATPKTARINATSTIENRVLNPFSGTNTGSVYNNTGDTVTLSGAFNSTLYYSKGAMVISALRFEVNNDSLFFLALRKFQSQFSGKTALGKDVKAVMEETTGKDFTQFFDQWYYGFGFPSFSIKWNQVNNKLMMKITESASVSAKTPLFKTSLEINVKRTQGDTLVRLFISQNISHIVFNCSGTVTGLTVDPNQWILNAPGTIAKDLTLDIFPVSFSGLQQICQPNANSQVYTSPLASGHSYNWTISGGNIVSGQGTNTINVNWTHTGSNQISVKECNAGAGYCDSALLKIIVGTHSTLTQDVSINPGDSLFLEGTWRKTGGSFTDHYTTSIGCDSSVTTNLSIITEAGYIQSSTHYFVFPNPASNTIVITGNQNKKMDVKIFNLLGTLRFSIDNCQEGKPIELNALSNGIYFVQISDAENKSVVELKKLIKN